MPLILVSAEKTCAFNNNKLFKRFKEKLAVTPGAITVHVVAWVHIRKWSLLPSMPGCGILLPPKKGGITVYCNLWSSP